MQGRWVWTWSPNRVQGQSPWRGLPMGEASRKLNTFAHMNLQSISPAISHVYVLNMRKSQSTCYAYRDSLPIRGCMHPSHPLDPSLIAELIWLAGVAIQRFALGGKHPRTPTACLSSLTFVRPTQEVETFGNIYSACCTLAILWPPCKIVRRSSQGNPSTGGVKRKRASKIERCHVRVSHLLMSLLL